MVDSLMPSIIVVVIKKSLDSVVMCVLVFLWVFLWLDVNVLVFYRFPKSSDPNGVFNPTETAHAPEERFECKSLGFFVKRRESCGGPE